MILVCVLLLLFFFTGNRLKGLGGKLGAQVHTILTNHLDEKTNDSDKKNSNTKNEKKFNNEGGHDENESKDIDDEINNNDGVYTAVDLQSLSLSLLETHFDSKTSLFIFNSCRGLNDDIVVNNLESKSVLAMKVKLNCSCAKLLFCILFFYHY